MLEIHQLRGIPVAGDEAHHAHAALEQPRLHRVGTADRGPVGRFAHEVTRGALESGHVRITRSGGHQQCIVRLEYVAEEGTCLRCALETVVGFVHHAADAHPFLPRQRDHRIDGQPRIAALPRLARLGIARGQRGPGHHEHAPAAHGIELAVRLQIQQDQFRGLGRQRLARLFHQPGERGEPEPQHALFGRHPAHHLDGHARLAGAGGGLQHHGGILAPGLVHALGRGGGQLPVQRAHLRELCGDAGAERLLEVLE